MLSTLVAAALQWVVLGPGGTAVVRAVVEQPDARCPAATVDGAERPLELRYAGGPGFPVTICELHLEPSVKEAKLRGLPLPLPKADAKRIVAVGDTGCRVKADEATGKVTVQNCDGAKDAEGDRWPWREIAQAAAAQSPDLVIHVGDYVYRKAPCPKGDARCARTSAHGANWEALKAELFEPAEALFKAAPWVVPRGNHEACDASKARTSQGGAPFFLLLDPRPMDALFEAIAIDPYLRSLQPGAIADARAACRDLYEPYVVPAGPALDLWVLDSNPAPDEASAADDELAETYALQLRKLAVETASRGKDRAWLLSHRPLYGAFPGSRSKKGKRTARELNVTLQKAFDLAKRPAELDLVISGHMHVFQWLAFQDGRLPAQLVVGNSGTALDRHFADVPELVDLSKRRYAVAGQPLKKRNAGEKVRGASLAEFGFVVLERNDGAWSARLVDAAGGKRMECGARGRLRGLACRAP